MTHAADSRVRVRDARPDELDEASEVARAAYQEYAASVPPNIWERYAVDIVDLRSRLGESKLIVAERDGRIVGSVTFYPGDSRRDGGWPDGSAGIRLLAVHPGSRGLGVGRELVEECLRLCRHSGTATLGLHTRDAMSVARGMYLRMGFVPVPEYDFRANDAFIVEAYRLDVGPA